MANLQVTTASGTAYVATNTITRDGVLENMELINPADPVTGLSASVTGAGTSGTNAQAVQGTTGGVPMPVSVGGNSSLITTLSSATASTPAYPKSGAGRVCRLVNTSTSPQTGITITILDQASGVANAANVIFSCVGMAAGQIIDLQIPVVNGVGIYASGATTGNIVLTYS